MKNPYIVALYPDIPDADTRPAEDLLKLSGKNLGNFMFCSSGRRFIRTTTQTNRQSIDLKVVRRECDGIVIMAANWMQPHHDFTGLADRVIAADLPTVILGIGAQTPDEKIRDLHPGMVKFLKAVSERSHSIAVRGEFSAKVLEHHGIHNAVVTGCPSLLWHMRHSAAVTRLPKPGQIGRVSVNGTLPDQVNPDRVEKRMAFTSFLLREAMAKGWDYVAQTELTLMQGARGEITDPTDDRHDYLRHVFDTDDNARIAAWLKRHLRAFGNIPEWLTYAANQDFIIGTRLHGVIAGLLAGTPSMLITHDSRTREMAAHAGIPQIDVDDLMAEGSIDPEALIRRCDFTQFNAVQRNYFNTYMGTSINCPTRHTAV